MDLLTLGAFPTPVYMSAVATKTTNRAMGKTAKAVVFLWGDESVLKLIVVMVAQL